MYTMLKVLNQDIRHRGCSSIYAGYEPVHDEVESNPCFLYRSFQRFLRRYAVRYLPHVRREVMVHAISLSALLMLLGYRPLQDDGRSLGLALVACFRRPEISQSIFQFLNHSIRPVHWQLEEPDNARISCVRIAFWTRFDDCGGCLLHSGCFLLELFVRQRARNS